jgi:hypothetical protein
MTDKLWEEESELSVFKAGWSSRNNYILDNGLANIC